MTLFASHAPNARGLSAAGQPLRGSASVVEAGAHLPVAERLSIDVGWGWQDNRRIGGTPYSYNSAGIAWGQGPIQLSLTWISSRADELGHVPYRVAGNRWVGTAWWSW